MRTSNSSWGARDPSGDLARSVAVSLSLGLSLSIFGFFLLIVLSSLVISPPSCGIIPIVELTLTPRPFQGSHDQSRLPLLEPVPAYRLRLRESTPTSFSSGLWRAQPPLLSDMTAEEVFWPAPARNPDLYGPRAKHNTTRCSQLAAEFFRDGVRRARERNVR